MLLLAFATQPLFGAPCTVDPPPRSAARQAVAKALMRAQRYGRDAKVQISFLVVCHDWALVDSVICDPECPEGGYSLMRKTHSRWRRLPLPDIADCDPMESPFIAVDNECLSATLRMYTDAPRSLFEPVKKRVTR